MSHFPPINEKEWIALLKKLGFEERRVGRGKHAHKFSHPTKHTKDYRIQPDFIIVPSKIYNSLSAKMIKEVIMFGFTLDEIQQAS